jgi:hypothetical protein
MAVDVALQAQIDAQLLEQGAFSPLEFLIDSGRLLYSDYERWRRGDLDQLDGVLMGDLAKIQLQLEQAASLARSMGLKEQPEDFFAWATPGPANRAHASLVISADPGLRRLIGSRFVPAQKTPQMDLFFDNPVVALSNGVAHALRSCNLADAQRQLDRLYAHAPNHADLVGFDRLVEALGRLRGSIPDVQQETDFLLGLAPIAKRLLGPQSRDFLTPLWRHLADALGERPFSQDQPQLHPSFALAQAHDWPSVSDAVRRESDWPDHPDLCLRMADSAFYRQRRSEALGAWCHVCWRAPLKAAEHLDQRKTPDTGIAGLWRQFLDNDEALTDTAEFPAWLLLHEPGLALQLAADLPTQHSPGEEHYRCVHRWIHARRAGRTEEEVALRRALQASQPILFSYLMRRV